MYEIACPHCGARLQIPDAHAGQTGTCPSCNNRVSTVRPGDNRDAITAEVPRHSGRSSAITTLDNIASERTEATTELPPQRVRWLSGGCFVGGAFAAVFALACVCFVWPVCQIVNRAQKAGATIVNMKEIGLACHAYHDTHKTFPTPRIVDAKDGKTVELSWRVSLTPHLSDKELPKLDLSQRWDSVPNASLAKAMPTAFFNPSRDWVEGSTYFQYFTGPRTLWPANAPITIKDIPDGWSSTILFAEAAVPVIWSKPADVAILPDAPIPLPEPIGGEGGCWFRTCFCDGSVRAFHQHNMSEAVLRSLIDPRDGGPINLP